MGPAEVREAIARYLDKGVDFVKYGGTTHKMTPSLILFSPRVQETIVDEVHARGKAVETHCTSSEALRISVLAGIDLIQHPEALDVPMTDELLQLIVDHDVICSINFDAIAGEVWTDYRAMVDERERARPMPNRPLTGLEMRLRSNWHHREWWRTNAQRLIEAGCRIATPSDTAALLPTSVMPETSRLATGYSNSPGHSTHLSIEGAVELGLTPMDAIVAATRNGAIACKSLDQFGTVEQGKSADLVVLDRNPLDDIHNIESVRHVVARGQLVDRNALPEHPVYSEPDRW
jgi:imidazolonepropionase-like amidohydrolase